MPFLICIIIYHYIIIEHIAGFTIITRIHIVLHILSSHSSRIFVTLVILESLGLTDCYLILPQLYFL